MNSKTQLCAIADVVQRLAQSLVIPAGGRRGGSTFSFFFFFFVFLEGGRGELVYKIK